MEKAFQRFLGSVLNGKGQVLLFLIILVAGAAIRLVFSQPSGLELNELAYTSYPAPFPGRVVYSDDHQDLYLVVNRGNLYWRRGEEERLLAEGVVNLLAQQDRIWLKTQAEVSELILGIGALVPLLSATSPECREIPFAQAYLVGRDEGRFYLHFDTSVLGIGPDGVVEGPYYLEGRRNPSLVEGDWRRGVALVRDNAWVTYTGFMEQDRTQHPLGILKEAVLSPDATRIIYAVQEERWTEVWHALSDGAEAELIYRQEMVFSDLEALWNPDQSMAAVSILGYQGEASYSDDFHSATFLYQPGQAAVLLNKSTGPEIKALVPTAWDAREPLLWLNWLHQETPIPVGFRLFSHRR
jgi:hypothetical protein